MSDAGFLHFKEVNIVSSLMLFFANYYCYHDQMNSISFEFALDRRIIIIAHLSQKPLVSYSVNSVQNLSVHLSVIFSHFM